MNRSFLLALVICGGFAAAASAQSPTAGPGNGYYNDAAGGFRMGELMPTPSMWFYEQARAERDDPKRAVRAQAEYQAAQRLRRLEAQRWYGYSAARPLVSATPMFVPTPSPQWTSGGRDLNRWSPSPWPATGQMPDPAGVYGYR